MKQCTKIRFSGRAVFSMLAMAAFVLSVFSGCTELPRLDPQVASKRAATFIKTLHKGGGETSEPMCVEANRTTAECTYSFKEGDKFKIASLLCTSTGCRQGKTAELIEEKHYTDHHSTMFTPEFLLWHTMLNSGSGRHYDRFDTWYRETPPGARTLYYTPTTRPAPAMLKKYRNTKHDTRRRSTPSFRSTPSDFRSTPSSRPSSRPSSKPNPSPNSKKPAPTQKSSNPKNYRSYRPSRSRSYRGFRGGKR